MARSYEHRCRRGRSTELTAVIGAVHTVRDAVNADPELRRTVDDHEQRLRAIEQRTGTG